MLLGISFAISMFKASATMTAIMDTFQISIGNAGNLMAIMGYVSMIISIPGGAIISRLGIKMSSLLCLGLAIIGNVVAIYSTSFSVLLISRIFEGIGFGMVGVIMQSIINNWFPPNKRGLPLSISNLYLSIGMIFILNISNVITPKFGWKGNWGLNLVFFLISMILFMIFFKMPYVESQAEIIKPKSESLSKLIKCLKSPFPWLLSLCFAAYAFSFAVFGTYFPTYLNQAFGISPALANMYTSIYNITFIISTIVFGFILNRVNYKKHSLVLLISMICYMIVSIPMFSLSDKSLIIPYCLIFGIVANPVAVSIFSIAPESFDDKSMIPLTLGVIMFGMGISGASGSIIVGQLIVYFGWSSIRFIYLVMAVLGLIAALILKSLLAKKYNNEEDI